jgi:hypothetical protein
MSWLSKAFHKVEHGVSHFGHQFEKHVLRPGVQVVKFTANPFTLAPTVQWRNGPHFGASSELHSLLPAKLDPYLDAAFDVGGHALAAAGAGAVAAAGSAALSDAFGPQAMGIFDELSSTIHDVTNIVHEGQDLVHSFEGGSGADPAAGGGSSSADQTAAGVGTMQAIPVWGWVAIGVALAVVVVALSRSSSK